MTYDFTALPPEDAVNYFRAKGFKLGFDWRDVWQDEHARAFTVAKAMTVDLLEDIRDVVDQAIANGIAFEDFRDNLEPILRARGWWGRQLMTDPLTGAAREVQLGSVRRLGIIYDTNLRTSLSAGTWNQIQRTKDELPYLRYVDPAANPRPEHLDWSGTVLRANDDWWTDHYPPNGWNCKCYVDSLGDEDLASRGLNESVAPPSNTYSYTNDRTGETTEIPEGIDPGFAHNPGIAGINYAAERDLAEKLATADPAVADAVEKAMPAPPPVRRNPASLNEAIADGERIAKELGGLPSADDPAAIAEWRARMLERLRADRGAGGVDLEFTSAGRGRGAELLREASAKYPDAWVKKSNAVGKVSARFNRSRGWHRSAPADAFGNFNSTIKLGYKKTAIHELGHRMQAVMPGLDNFFSQLHARRTAGEPLERLSHLKPRGRFDWNEVARPDKYADAYFGKEYSGTPLELLTMSYQGLLHGGLQDGDQDLIERMLTKDPEMLNLALGLLFNYEP